MLFKKELILKPNERFLLTASKATEEHTNSALSWFEVEEMKPELDHKQSQFLKFRPSKLEKP